MKRFIQCILVLLFSICFTFLVSVLILLPVSFYGYSSIRKVDIDSVVKNLSVTDAGYELSDKMQISVAEAGCFLLLIDENGDVCWDFCRPQEVATHYSYQDVASFSRWYLQGYPVNTWQYEDTLLVVGYPKDTFWKYSVSMPQKQFVLSLFLVFPIWLVGLILIFYLIQLWDYFVAKRNEKARMEWIAGVSHDIRTPLTMIMGYSAQLQKEAELSEEARREVGVICRQSERIRDLTEDFNLVNKLQYAGLRTEKQRIKPAGLLRSVLTDVVNGGPDERYELVPQIDASLENVRILGNEQLLYRAIFNLIRNSMVHNPQGCKITVSGTVRGSRVLLCVRDNGKGFPDGTLKQSRRKKEGLSTHGLGLMIVKRIVSVHRGRLRLYNEGGAVASISLAKKRLVSR